MLSMAGLWSCASTLGFNSAHAFARASLWCRVPVTVTTIYRDDSEVQAARGGENLRLRLTGIDEEDIAAGFVICSRNAPVPCVTYFQAQLQVTMSWRDLCTADATLSTSFVVDIWPLCKVMAGNTRMPEPSGR
jgi:translation elongation factor EF-1alpha